MGGGGDGMVRKMLPSACFEDECGIFFFQISVIMNKLSTSSSKKSLFPENFVKTERKKETKHNKFYQVFAKKS